MQANEYIEKSMRKNKLSLDWFLNSPTTYNRIYC